MFSTDLSTRSYAGCAVVALRGELDLADAAVVAAELTAVAARGPGLIVVDLAGLEFIDSCGVAALAHGRGQTRQAGGDLILAAPQPQVMRVLAVLRLPEALSVYATVEEAAGQAARSQAGATPLTPRPRVIAGGDRGRRAPARLPSRSSPGRASQCRPPASAPCAGLNSRPRAGSSCRSWSRAPAGCRSRRCRGR
jgi:anti-sigma B factor antagonist